MQKKVILTGDRPTGPLHLGHYVGSLQNRVKLQNDYKQYLLIADMQALTDNATSPELITDNVLNVVADYLAAGIDPEVTTICLQSRMPELAALTMYYLNLLTLNQIERNPTVKEEIRQKDYGNRTPMGFLIYPVSQAADITAFKADLVPVGADQIPMIEDTNAIVRKFNQTYNCEVLKECEALVPEGVGRLIGTDGKAKMSKSLGNAIYLKDEGDELWKKVRSMYTDPDHLKVEDPGKVEGNVVFTYLDAFAPEAKAREIQEMKDHYQRGGLGDMVTKKYLMEVLEDFLKPMQERRKNYKAEDLTRILNEGSEKAREVVVSTEREVQRAIGLSAHAYAEAS